MVKHSEECVDAPKYQTKQKKVHSGKVIRFFTVEVIGSGSDPILDTNPSNPYTELSEEERLRDLIEMFGILWGETCREKSQRDGKNKLN